MPVFHPRLMAARPTVVVLAAGRSSRFGVGHHKLAQPLGETTVLAQTLANAIATHLRTVVVTIAAFVDVARSSVAARDVVVLPEVGSDGGSQLGMGASIAAGVGR
jgi:molybdenum cofactor cytidylyltransferase